jgi:hypothetical protein
MAVFNEILIKNFLNNGAGKPPGKPVDTSF